MNAHSAISNDSNQSTAKGAYEQAQKKADNFAALPDDELALELKQLDEEEKRIIEEADRERDEMIERELLYIYQCSSLLRIRCAHCCCNPSIPQRSPFSSA